MAVFLAPFDIAGVNEPTNPLALMGSQIRLLRQERRLSQEALAELIGIHRNRVSEIESGKHAINIWTLFRIAAALQSSPAVLFSRFDAQSWADDRTAWPKRNTGKRK